MKIIYLILISCVFTSCSPKKAAEPPFDRAAYNLEIETWHQKRIESLKGPNGYLNLAGLFWLDEGINTFGSGPKNSVVFPEGKIPERAGFFFLKQNTVTLEAARGVKILCEGQPIKKMVVFDPDSSKAPIQEFGSLRWFIIKRDTKYGVRLRDLENPAIGRFTGIERYPVDPSWALEAKFEKADPSRTIGITNILGQTTPMPTPGTLVFAIQGTEYRLDAIDEGEGIEDLFIIFGDLTNAKETYGAGRYVYVKKPGADGKTILDFNKAYNPPCAFTAFATCPLPPRQNILGVEITAGEKELWPSLMSLKEMKNRIEELFRVKQKNILSVFYTAGFPKLDDTIRIAECLEEAGVDLIEIGIPFSDPIADGPVIQDSNLVALNNGMSVKKLLAQVKEIRNRVTLPVILMGYLNPVLQYDIRKFCSEASEAGVDGLIFPDLPMDVYQNEYKKLFEGHGLSNTFLISPTTSEKRIRKIDENTRGFIYAVSASSTTGVKGEFSPEQEIYFKKLQAMKLKNPFLIGFGISNHRTFSKTCVYGSGAVVGSAFISMLKDSKDLGNDIRNFVSNIKSELP